MRSYSLISIKLQASVFLLHVTGKIVLVRKRPILVRLSLELVGLEL
jgi:hypothetical protein